MNFHEYQTTAGETAIYPHLNEVGRVGPLLYPALGLSSEAGEVAGKIKKLVRDCNGEVPQDAVTAIAGEIGDCLWYIAELCTQLGVDMEDVAAYNANQLKSRAERGKLQGSGDDR